MDKIIMKNMEFYGYHGVMPEEREKGQRFFIDAELGVDLKKPGVSDELDDTVDYSKVYDVIRYMTENKKFRLIEKLADSISREIMLKNEKVLEITVRVRKPDAPIEGKFEWMGVELKRRRNDEL